MGASGELVRLFAISAIALVLFAGGVYWLRQLPANSSVQESGTMVEVQLLPPGDPTPTSVRNTERQATAAPGDKGRSSDPQPQLIEDREEPSPQPVAVNTPAAPIDLSPAVSRQAPSDDATMKFRQALLRHIARYERYPSEARARHEQGTVEVLFHLRRNGRVIEAWVTTTSGAPLLDQEAIATLYRAEPLPPIPSEMPEELKILLPINFSLQ
jgi:periplasmic protein TonB